jgi:hypothetical protein
MMLAEVQEFVGIESFRLGHHLSGRAQDVRHDVQSGAVRHRCRVHEAAVFGGSVDVGQVRDGHRCQIAVREHRALGAAGGSAGVE